MASTTPRPQLVAKLADAVQELRSSNAPAWETFLKALGARAELIINDCISSPVHDLPVAQGRAREARDLLTELERGPGVAEQMQESRKQHGRYPHFKPTA